MAASSARGTSRETHAARSTHASSAFAFLSSSSIALLCCWFLEASASIDCPHPILGNKVPLARKWLQSSRVLKRVSARSGRVCRR